MQRTGLLRAGILAGALTAVSAASAAAAPIVIFERQTSGSQTYQVDTQAVNLVPFVGFEGSSSGRNQKVFSLSLPKFDPLLGTMTEMTLLIDTDVSMRHSYLGACESPITITCSFTAEARSSTRFGIDVKGLNDHIIGPPGHGGISELPVDLQRTHGFNSSATSVLILAASRSTSTPSQFGLTPPPEVFQNFIGPGSFNVFFEMLSATNTDLTCFIGLFSVCQAGVQVTNRWDVSARVVYGYEPFVAPPPSVPEPVTLALVALGVGGSLVRSRCRRASFSQAAPHPALLRK